MVAGWTILALAAGCALPGPKTANRSPTPAPSAISARDHQGRVIEESRQKVAASLRAERYPAALALIRSERRRNPAIFTEEYLQALKLLAAAADRHFQKDEMEAAGKALRAILDYFPEEAAVLGRFGSSRQDLEASLNACADRLMELGLTRYRSGDLPGAIIHWQQILTFQSDHEVARRNIHTADVQLKRLRALP